MILSDSKIIELAEAGMIAPFENHLIRTVPRRSANGGMELSKVISYGLSSYGYDIRLSPNEFKIFRHIPGTIVDPKQFKSDNLETVKLREDRMGKYFIIPAHSYALGVAIEKLNMPPDVTGICIGKSTYARIGVIANLTPVEAGWKGHLTIELSNSANSDCCVYSNEGIVQILFFQGEKCRTSYENRNGKYQNQKEVITLPKV